MLRSVTLKPPERTMHTTDDALPIGEVARRSGVPATTLRYYESIGILPEVERRSGRRAYPPSIIEVLAVVRAARQAGLNLDAVKLLVADGEGLPERRWRQVGEDRIRAIDDAVAGLERARRMVGLLMACQCRTIVECGRRLASQPIAETECELCSNRKEISMELPIACTLTAEELTDRRSLWRRVDTEVASRSRVDEGFRIAYATTPEVERLLPSLADAESRCCSFASWRLAKEGEQLVLSVSGPADGIEVLCHEFGVD